MLIADLFLALAPDFIPFKPANLEIFTSVNIVLSILLSLLSVFTAMH